MTHSPNVYKYIADGLIYSPLCATEHQTINTRNNENLNQTVSYF